MLPQDIRQDCGNQSYPWNLAGVWGTARLTLNLTVDKNIQTRTFEANGERFEAPTQIVISPNCTLKINSGKTFTVEYDDMYLSPRFSILQHNDY